MTYFVVLAIILSIFLISIYQLNKKIDVITYKSFNSKKINMKCKIYSFTADSQPNFITFETCDGKLESLIVTKEVKICASKIISLSPEIKIDEIGIC